MINERKINPDDYLLLLLDGPPFEGMMQRHQQLMTRLARKVRVIYQEESASIVSYLFKRRFPIARAFAYKQGIREIAPNLWHVFSPPGFPERFGLTRVNHKNHLVAYRHMAPYIRLFGGKLIVWIAHPKAVEVIDHIGCDLCIYDCYDAFGDFAEEKWKAAEIKNFEKELLEKADLVLASAKSLVETRGRYNSNVHLIPNGADTGHFQRDMSKPLRHYTPDISTIKRPIVGYMGDIASWLDVIAVEKCAKTFTDASFVFLGTVKRNVDRLKALPNVHFFGRIDYNDLPFFLRHFDVCTIPFEINEMTVHVNPIKVYEYMATGLPIVSSNLPEVNDLEDLVYIYQNTDGFVAKVKTALDEKQAIDRGESSDLMNRRRKKAEENSWSARADRIWELIEEKLEEKISSD